jgi:hypothetical protein
MSLVLKNPNRDMFPPGGGFSFVDPKTNFRVNGLEGTLEQTAQKVVDHRRANPNVYPASEVNAFELGLVIQEIFLQKFATHPYLFVGGGEQPGTWEAAQKTPELGSCICGETKVEPVYCPTCGGQRITGYRCIACKAERS